MNVPLIGVATPGRANVTFTFVPGVPVSESETWLIVQPRVDSVSDLDDAVALANAAGFGRRVRIDRHDADELRLRISAR